jgi:uncharacterized protein with HEPN domain
MKRDKAYLKHILEAISNIEKFVEGLMKEGFFENVENQYAVLRGLEIIGEATKNLSRELRAKYHKVPWKDIPVLWISQNTRKRLNDLFLLLIIVFTRYN